MDMTKKKKSTSFKKNMDELTNLTAESEIQIVIKDSVYIMKPVSARLFFEYQEVEEKDKTIKSKAFIVSECLISPRMTADEILDQPVGLLGILYNELMNASFLIPPTT
jgi:hypothetical protein